MLLLILITSLSKLDLILKIISLRIVVKNASLLQNKKNVFVLYSRNIEPETISQQWLSSAKIKLHYCASALILFQKKSMHSQNIVKQ